MWNKRNTKNQNRKKIIHSKPEKLFRYDEIDE